MGKRALVELSRGLYDMEKMRWIDDEEPGDPPSIRQWGALRKLLGVEGVTYKRADLEYAKVRTRSGRVWIWAGKNVFRWSQQDIDALRLELRELKARRRVSTGLNYRPRERKPIRVATIGSRQQKPNLLAALRQISESYGQCATS